MKTLKLTAEQIAYAKANYKPGIPGHGAQTVARALGISYDGFLRNFSPEYRALRNRQAAESMRRKRKTPDEPIARTKITLPRFSWDDEAVA